jgi:hypothetical protein
MGVLSSGGAGSGQALVLSLALVLTLVLVWGAVAAGLASGCACGKLQATSANAAISQTPRVCRRTR